MKNVAILFDSVHGQTRKIAEHLDSQLKHLKIQSTLIQASEEKSSSLLHEGNFDALVIGSPVYASQFLPSVLKLVRLHQDLIQSKPLAVFTVSLNAADQHQTARQADLNLLQKLMDQTGTRPQYLASFSGSLMYREYNWLLRFFLRRIARKAGGDTDTSRNYEYTNWQQVDAFLQAFIEDNRRSEFAISRKMNRNQIGGLGNAASNAAAEASPSH